LFYVLALEFPGGVDDLFLEVSELAGPVLALLLAALGLAVHSLTLTEDFFEWTHFAKIKITGGTANLAIGSNVVRPEEPCDEFVGLNTEVFHSKDVLKRFLLL